MGITLVKKNSNEIMGYKQEIESIQTFLTINFERLRFRLSRKEEKKKAEDIIFEMIYRVSNGNPGVAKVVWEKSLQ